MSLEDLEKELYGQSDQHQRSDYHIKQSSQNREKKSDAWSDDLYYHRADTVSDAPLTFFGKYGFWIIGGFILITLILLGFIGYYLYQYVTTKDISMDIVGPSSVVTGVPFTISATFTNLSRQTLVTPQISLALPDGVLSLDGVDKRIVDVDVDDAGPGAAVKKDFRVVILGEPTKTYVFTTRIAYSYGSGSLSGRFNKEQTFATVATDAGIGVNFSAPDKVLSGEDFEIDITYQNNTTTSFDNVTFILSLPQNFTINNSEPKLSGNSVVVKHLEAGQNGVIILSGSLAGSSGSFAPIKIATQISFLGKLYTLSETAASLAINESLLGLSITPPIAKDGGEYIAYPGDKIDYTITFTNRASIALHDSVLEASVSGDMIDFSSVTARSGFFDSAKGVAQWTGAHIPALSLLEPGESGTVMLSMKTKDAYPIHQLSDKNFSIKIRATINSPTVPQNIVASKTMGIVELATKVGGTLLAQQTLYHAEPAETGIVNNGTLPPRVGTPVQYTVHWKIGAYGADFNGVVVRATLAPGVAWTGKLTANTSSTPFYNERTQEIAWDIGSLAAGSGAITKGPEAIFQIQITPQLYMKGSPIPLISATVIQERDVFIGKESSQTIKEATSKNLSDVSLPNKYDRVVE